MSRAEKRAKNRLENNPVAECNKIQARFFPKLFEKFGEADDPRHQSYVRYGT